jgi:CRISPR system Cascade subunit CasE
MYLTKLTLNLRSAQARRDLGDAYEMHRTLVRAFAPYPQSSPPRFLWRLEVATDAVQNPPVLIQSDAGADWSVLERLPNYLQRSAETKKVELARLVRLDRRYRFRLLANPTVCRQGKRLALLKQEEHTAWIERQGAHHGFRIQALTISPHELLNSSRDGKASICVQRICFEGFLEVCQTAAFEQALIAGIGPAKAFGCGLLSVAPC